MSLASSLMQVMLHRMNADEPAMSFLQSDSILLIVRFQFDFFLRCQLIHSVLLKFYFYLGRISQCNLQFHVLLKLPF